MSGDAKPEKIDQFAGSSDIYQGGFILYRRANGEHFIEHTEGTERGDDDEPLPWDLFSVRRVGVPDDVWAEFDWADKEAVTAFADFDAEDGTDPNPMTRAHAMVSIGEFHGFANLDDYPLRLSYRELRQRWEGEDEDDVAVELFDDAGPWGVPEPMGLLYALLVKAEKEKWDLGAMLLEAKRMRHRAVHSDSPPRQLDEAILADDLAARLNREKPHTWEDLTIEVRGKDWCAATVTFDKRTKIWGAKPNAYEDK